MIQFSLTDDVPVPAALRSPISYRPRPGSLPWL
jgi:hypothetical protein